MSEKLSNGQRTAITPEAKLCQGIVTNTDLAKRGAGLSRGPNMMAKNPNASWTQTWPSPGATLDLDFANDRGFVRGVGNGRSMDAVTFTRASNARYIDSSGLSQNAANNTPRFDWASTTSTGSGTQASPYVIPLQANPTCNGLLIEESRTNRALWCRDATQASWVKTSITVAKDQTGIDGVANSASSLTASSPNGTAIQTITLASGSRTASVYLKRITGTGTIQVSLDGSTWSSVDLSNGLWNRVVLSGTVTNPIVGIKIVTSGDAVAMDFAQIEDGAFVTSPILTTSATVTRAVDSASISGANFYSWFNALQGSFYAIYDYQLAASNGGVFYTYPAGPNTYMTMSGSGSSGRTGWWGFGLTQLGIALTTTNKQSLSYNNSGYFSASLNGNAAVVTTTSSSPSDYKGTSTGLIIGSAFNFYLNGRISRIVYIPKMANQNILQDLSGMST